MVQIDETVSVSVDQNGKPVGFQWRGGRFTVADKPIRWFARKPWWAEASRVHRGVGVGVIEVEMWRLMAISASVKHKTQYDLQHSTQDNSWRLMLAYD